ncbi:restriction endonuclease [Leifsonia sp. NPDC056665]|uniref:restriction endonuclease n=1 Tax=Leifsonia sp. NPDC056665 TaxID=3345901 RepID=UPI0036CB5729
MISIGALRGYVLEEVLAKLLQGSGYDLLVDASQDPEMLINGSNGLRIHGRGAQHQADVLGELRVRPTFTYPLRLFVEAKCRKRSIGLLELRNALGVINDVNEYYTGVHASTGMRRHDYRYVLFSTSGFTGDAERYALAQRISLVDLGAPAFQPLIKLVSRIADQLLYLAKKNDVDSFPVNQMREAFRKAFGTWTTDPRAAPSYFDDAKDRAARLQTASQLPANALAAIAADASEIGERLSERLYFVFNDTAFVFVGRSDDLQADEDDIPGARAYPRVAPGGRADARLAFAGDDEAAGEWTLVTTDPGPGRGSQIRFANSPAINTLLTGDSDDQPRRRKKQQNTVVIAVEDDLLEVDFEPVIRTRGTTEKDVRAWNVDKRLAFRAEKDDRPQHSEEVTEYWTRAAIEELFNRLPDAYKQTITEAARNDGYITRDTAYEIFNFPATRMLRGFTRPPRRVAMELIEEGALHPETEWPLFTVYDAGVRATRFGVPPEFTWLLG